MKVLYLLNVYESFEGYDGCGDTIFLFQYEQFYSIQVFINSPTELIEETSCRKYSGG